MELLSRGLLVCSHLVCLVSQNRPEGLQSALTAKDLGQNLKVTIKRIQTGEGWDCCMFPTNLFSNPLL